MCPSISILCFILLQEFPIQLLAEKLLTTCSLTMFLIETSGYFQVDLKSFGSVFFSQIYWNIFFHLLTREWQLCFKAFFVGSYINLKLVWLCFTKFCRRAFLNTLQCWLQNWLEYWCWSSRKIFILLFFGVFLDPWRRILPRRLKRCHWLLKWRNDTFNSPTKPWRGAKSQSNERQDVSCITCSFQNMYPRNT